MIIRTASPKFFAPVTLKQLDAKGALVELKFDAQFKRIKQSEFDALMKSNRDQAEQRKPQLAAGADVSGQLKDQFTQLLETHMVGWSGVQDEGLHELAFSASELAGLCNEYAGMQLAIVEAFYASFTPSAAAHLAAKN